MSMLKDHAKLRWRCRRGMRELDLLLGRFLERQWATLTQGDWQVLALFLESSDAELYDWLIKQMPPPAEFQSLVAWIRAVHMHTLA